MAETILLDIANGVATLTLNRPHRKNSIDMIMCREVYEALYDLSYRKDVNILVLTGAEGAFCPGGDIKAIVSGEMAEQMAAGFNQVIYRVPVLLHDMPQLTIAAINGACAGAGLGWALGCDLRYATASAKFTTAFLDRGFSGDMSVPWSLPRVIGPAKARELSFFPDVFTAHEAEAFGVVNGVYEDTDFSEGISSRLSRLRAAKPEALRYLKEHYVYAERMSFADYSDYETRTPSGGADPKEFAKFLDRDKAPNSCRE